ncbi:serine/threonine protein kinase [Myxococcota bacterium]|nr:serine/threonine protein kinase [Myxococcota bacterium]
MADVFLGIQRGVQSFRQLVVIKRIRDQFITDPHALQMFIDEALTVASLSHPHIVAIHDLREIENSLCIAMEYVDGETLTFLLNQLHRKRAQMPLDIAAKIVIEACEALNAAHTALGADGEPLNLIHRDVTPHNLMLDRNGYLKIIDFGIAKSRLQEEKTTPGMVKGKFSYLSPDHFQSTIDARSDIYSLGLVFFELVTSQRAIKASELSFEQLMRVVLNQPLPPASEINDQLPKGIDAVLAKATAKDRDKRYLDAEAFADDIRALMRDNGGIATNARMRAWMQEHFSQCIANRQALERRLLKEADEQSKQMSLSAPNIPEEAHPCEGQEACAPVRVRSKEESDSHVVASQTRIFEAQPPPNRNTPLWALLAVVSSFLTYFAFFNQPNEMRMRRPELTVAPTQPLAALSAPVDPEITRADPLLPASSGADASPPRDAVLPAPPDAALPPPPSQVKPKIEPSKRPTPKVEPRVRRPKVEPPKPEPPKPEPPASQYLSGHGRWSGRDVVLKGCKSCHAQMDFVAIPSGKLYRAFARSSHPEQGTLGKLFSARELSSGRRYIRDLKKKNASSDKSSGSNIAGVQ